MRVSTRRATAGILHSRVSILPTLLLAFMFLFAGTIAQAQTPTITTDQADYAPGTTCTITGTGFNPNDSIWLVVKHADGTPDTGADHEPFLVIAEPDGSFVGTWHVCEDDCVNSTLKVTADAAPSGLHAEAIFTDAISHLVISQIYGGGGNANAPYQKDFIEIFNPQGTVVTLTGWSVQYASAAGTSWNVINLSGSIAAGKYYLVQMGGTGGVGAALPTPDATGSIDMSGTTGKVALVSNNSPLSGTCPTGITIVDFVGYGNTANCFEGASFAPAPNNTNADIRKSAGCIDDNVNSTDFLTGAPTPRNSSTAANYCNATILNFSTPATQSAGVGFAITVTAQNAGGFAQNVTTNTLVTLTANGSTIGGTTTGTIMAGTNSITISGITLTASAAATITATASGGETLTAKTSGSFAVITPGSPALAITGTTAHGSVCPNNSASSQTYTITNTGTVQADGISVGSSDPQFVVSGLSSTSIPASGGTATYLVTFTPASAGAKSATITVGSSTSGSNSPSNSLTGSGITPVTQAVSSSSANSLGNTTATLNGNVTTLGVCPSTTEKGFVYAQTSANSNPLVAGTGVTKTAVSGLTTGAFSLALSGLTQGTGYTFKAYVFDGTTYTYGSATSFTTTVAPANDLCANAITLTPGAAAISGTTVAATVSTPFNDDTDVWYKFTATCSGTTTITSTQTSQDIDLYVWNTSCPSATTGNIGTGGFTGSITSESMTINAIEGTTYFIRAVYYSATTNSNAGPFTISVNGPTPVNQAVTTSPATSLGLVTATLNGNLTVLGVCPSTTEKGFVYSLSATNSDPLVAGTGVTKTSVSGLTTGTFSVSLSGLNSGAGYSVKAYAFNGTTYTYGSVVTFTTTATPPTLTAAAGATVDAPFNVTFSEDATWRNNVTSITVGGTTLAASAYNKSVAGQITFIPSASTLLQSAANKAIVVIANGYTNASVTQPIGAGAANKLSVTTQPAGPAVNGGSLATQPVVAVTDQYNNATTSTATITASAVQSTWTLGGTLNAGAVSGSATFSGLTATSSATITGATIAFSSPGLIGTTSAGFTIQGPDYVDINLPATAFTQDFNTLASSGSSSVTPQGWRFLESGSNANTTYAASTGNDNTGNTYSFGLAGNSDRAFGGLQSGSLNPIIGAKFRNNSGGTIVALKISYRGEQWRLGNLDREDRMIFSYSTNATSLASTFIPVPGLDFIAPTTSGTVGALNGNTNASIVSGVITNLNISAGSDFWVGWSDFAADGADDGLGIDDFSITACNSVITPTVSVSVTDGQNPTCANNAVTLTATPTNGGSNPVYLWKKDGVTVGSNSPTYTDPGITGGSITCTVINDIICASSPDATSSAIALVVNSRPVASATVIAPACYNSNGTVVVSAINGSGNYGSTVGSFIVAPGAAYSFTVTDDKGCTSNTITGTMAAAPSQIAFTATATQPKCYGEKGSVVLSMPTGGTGAITYNSTPTTNLSAGSYTYTATDANNCSVSQTVVINAAPLQISFTATATQPKCYGEKGSVVLSMPTGGTGAITYNSTPTTNLSAGSYTYTATDANNCSVSQTVVINAAPSQISFTATATQPKCYGEKGSVVLSTPTGGTGAITYNATATNNLEAGSYTYTATDANNCSVSQTVVINAAPSQISFTATATQPKCYGEKGSVVLSTPTGGTGTITYNATATTNLSAGSYTYTATDANNCSVSQTVVINAAPSQISFTATATQPKCYGEKGSVALSTPTGGTGAITYNSTPTTNLSAGSYTYTATDANNCSVSQTVVINAAPSQISFTATATQPKCYGEKGSVVLSTPTGGTGSITYNATATNNLEAGSYTYTATDANNCSVSQTVVINAAPSQLSFTATATQPKCYGEKGSVVLSTPTGGTGSITYNATATNNLEAGSYTYTATDANNCSVSQTVVINAAPSQISFTATATQPKCYGEKGSVVLSTPTGGTGAITYNSTPTTNLSAGSYTYTATDANNCSVSQTVVINAAPSQISFTATATQPKCYGEKGSVVLSTPTGGTGAITYNATATNNLEAGSYTYTATDANNCSVSQTVVINAAPSQISFTATATQPKCYGEKGSVVLSTPTGGTGAITYNATATTNLSAGSYTYTATDANNCSVSQTVVINAAPSQLIASSSATSILCNGGTSIVTVSATGGTAPYSGVGTFARNAGTYTFTVTDANGCTKNTSVTIGQPSALSSTVTTNNAILYFGYSGDQTATITAKGLGGTGLYKITLTMDRALKCNMVTTAGDELWMAGGNGFTNNGYVVCPGTGAFTAAPSTTWTGVGSNGSVSVNVTLLADAIITATITDANGCTTTSNVSIHAEDVRCFAGNSGNAKVTLCHQTGNSKTPCIKICVDESAVPEHLAHGDFVGNCTSDCVAPPSGRGTTTVTETDVIAPVKEAPLAKVLSATAMPNPSPNYFNIVVKGKSAEPVTVTVRDLFGRKVEFISNVGNNALLQLGHNWNSGTYFVEVVQGSDKQVLKLIKLK